MAGGCAVLAKEGDLHSLSEGISRPLTDKNLRERLVNIARGRVEKKYNWHCIADSLICAYEKILK